MASAYSQMAFDFDDCDAFLASLNNSGTDASASTSSNSGTSPSVGSLGANSPISTSFLMTDKNSYINGAAPGTAEDWSAFNFESAPNDPQPQNFISGNMQSLNLIQPDNLDIVKREHFSPSSPSSAASDNAFVYDDNRIVKMESLSSTSSPPSAIDFSSQYANFSNELNEKSMSGTHSAPVSRYSTKSSVDESDKSPTTITTNSRVTKPRKEKTSHNMIEKRYRTNINDKILALRDCVPSLRCAVVGKAGEEDLEGLAPASKLNKATVLTKATEYIMHLQKRNNNLQQEVENLRAQVNATALGRSAQGPASGSHRRSAPGGSTSSNVMMCSMAGLMGTGLMANDSDGRGLSALPFVGQFFTPGTTPVLQSGILFLKLALIVAVIFNVFIYPRVASISSGSSKVSTVSSSSLRSQTWQLTSTQLGVPSDNLSTAISTIQVIAEILACSLIGRDGYASFLKVAGISSSTFSSEAEDLWVRSMDSQLCGGDPFCTRVSLFYMFLKSFVLPQTLNVLIIQTIYLQLLSVDSSAYVKYFLVRWAKRRWSKAATIYSSQSTSSHLSSLLQAEFDDVFDDVSTERFYSLALGGTCRKTSDEGYNSVINDQSIQSASDLLSALYSSKMTNKYLLAHLEDEDTSNEALDASVNVAPDSIAHVRAVILKSLYGKEQEREQYLKLAMELVSDGYSLTDDAKVALGCSVVNAACEKDIESALALMKRIDGSSRHIGIMGFSALYSTLNRFVNLKPKGCVAVLEALATNCRVWIGGKQGDNSGIPLQRRRQLAGDCVFMTAHFGGISASEVIDEGYASMETE